MWAGPVWPRFHSVSHIAMLTSLMLLPLRAGVLPGHRHRHLYPLQSLVTFAPCLYTSCSHGSPRSPLSTTSSRQRARRQRQQTRSCLPCPPPSTFIFPRWRKQPQRRRRGRQNRTQRIGCSAHAARRGGWCLMSSGPTLMRQGMKTGSAMWVWGMGASTPGRLPSYPPS